MSEPVVYDTAFILMRTEDGVWSVTGDLATSFEVRATPTRQDVRIGCQEIIATIAQQDIAAIVVEAVASILQENSLTDSQRISASMRDAVSRSKSKK